MDRQLGTAFNEGTLAESSVTIKLLAIQQRCKDLLDDPEHSIELSLVEPVTGNPGKNPYERG